MPKKDWHADRLARYKQAQRFHADALHGVGAYHEPFEPTEYSRSHTEEIEKLTRAIENLQDVLIGMLEAPID